MNNPLLSASEQAHINAVRYVQHDYPTLQQDQDWASSRLTATVAAIGRWLYRYLPLIVALALIFVLMDGVRNNYTAQWIMSLNVVPPLAIWLANHASAQDGAQ